MTGEQKAARGGQRQRMLNARQVGMHRFSCSLKPLHQAEWAFPWEYGTLEHWSTPNTGDSEGAALHRQHGFGHQGCGHLPQLGAARAHRHSETRRPGWHQGTLRQGALRPLMQQGQTMCGGRCHAICIRTSVSCIRIGCMQWQWRDAALGHRPHEA